MSKRLAAGTRACGPDPAAPRRRARLRAARASRIIRPVTDSSSRPGPIRAVLFDWGGVLEVLPAPADFAVWEPRLGLRPGSLQDILWGETWSRVEAGAVGRDVYEAEICARCGFPDQAALYAFYEAFYPRRLQPALFAAVAALRPRYRVALVTNAWTGQRRHIAELTGRPVESLFDVYVNSAEVGARKPTPAIFHVALERLGVQPAEAIFLDDLPVNVAAASALGIHAILVETPEAALSALAAALGHPLAPATPRTG